MYDIFAKILKIARNGTGKTRIMYLANLSFESLEEYLKTLIELELIEPCGENGSVYKTSAKGMKYLSTFAMLRKTVS